MADSKRELIMKAVVAALDATGKPAGLVVNRLLGEPPVAPAELPTASVWAGRPGSALDEDVSLARPNRLCQEVKREFYFTISLRVPAATAAPDADLDVYSQWVTKAVNAIVEVGGRGVNILEAGSKWILAEAPSFRYRELLTIFRADYTTQRADLTQ